MLFQFKRIKHMDDQTLSGTASNINIILDLDTSSEEDTTTEQTVTKEKVLSENDFLNDQEWVQYYESIDFSKSVRTSHRVYMATSLFPTPSIHLFLIIEALCFTFLNLFLESLCIDLISLLRRRKCATYSIQSFYLYTYSVSN